MIEVDFEGETLNGIPHGIALLTYNSKGSGGDSFKGMAFMMDGKINGGPALFIKGNDARYMFSYMHHGRPYGYGRLYNKDNISSIVNNAT